jgi:uncharacterized protein
MKLEYLLQQKDQLYAIAKKNGIKKISLFGSYARRENSETSDLDLLVEMEQGASAFGIGGFQYEVQELLGIEVDVIPTFALSRVNDIEFIKKVQAEAFPI